MRDDRHVIVGVVEDGLQPHRREAQLIHFDVEADLLQLALDDRAARRGVGQRRHPQPQCRVLCPCGLEQRLGLRHVMWIHAGQVLVPRVGRRHHAPDQLAVSRETGLHQSLVVDAVAYGLTNPLVGEGLPAVVERQHHLAVARAVDDLVFVVALELRQRLRGVDTGDDVDGAAEQGVVERRAVLEVLQHDRLEIGLVAPIPGVALQRDRVAAVPVLELVGPRADRFGGDRLGGGRGHHGADAGRHPIEPVVARMGERDLQGRRIHRLRLGDDVHRRLQRDRPVLLDPIDRIHGVLGGERLAVGELRVVDQVEGVGLAVLRDVPGLRQGGHDLAALVELHQGLVDVVEQSLRNGGSVRRGEVHALRLGTEADLEGLRRHTGLLTGRCGGVTRIPTVTAGARAGRTGRGE